MHLRPEMASTAPLVTKRKGRDHKSFCYQLRYDNLALGLFINNAQKAEFDMNIESRSPGNTVFASVDLVLLFSDFV